jgi:hypothetical protein
MRIFILEDNPERIKKFKRELIGHILIIVEDVESAKEIINSDTESNKYDLMFLDHDLGGEEMVSPGDNTGYLVAKILSESINKNSNCIIHSCNHAGARAMQFCLPKAILIPFPSLDIQETIKFFSN